MYENELDKMRERMLRETEEFLTRSLKDRENASRKQAGSAPVADIMDRDPRHEIGPKKDRTVTGW